MTEQSKEVYEKNAANFVELTPLSFLERAADLYPDYPSLIYNERQYTWKETYQRCRQLADALQKNGVKTGDTVSVLAANTPEMYELHFAVPMAGAVLNTINYRLDPDTVQYILNHADASVLFTDTQFSPLVKQALAQVEKNVLVIDIDDSHAVLADGEGERLGTFLYQDLLESGDVDFTRTQPTSEWQALSLNYTSGTSGRPKGVIYHHRGSYLMSMGTIAAWPVTTHAKYLYTAPMFHCNGWGHAWTLAAVAGMTVCCRYIDPKEIFKLINQHQITHFGAAPIVLNMLALSEEAKTVTIDHPVEVMTAGAPPPCGTLEASAKLGFNITHVYGLTETYGHVIYCAWRDEWSSANIEQQAELKSRQGVRFPMTELVKVINQETGEEVPHDGETLGEIVIRSNTMMKGYYKDEQATAKAFQGGWFHSEDLAVVYPDGYLQVRDRLKDIIISGGENISSIELETVLYKHPAVLYAAVVARPDDKWGETPCAFLELKSGMEASEKEIIDFCKTHVASFKTPKSVVFKELPKTSTGKIQKFVLREYAKKMA